MTVSFVPVSFSLTVYIGLKRKKGYPCRQGDYHGSKSGKVVTLAKVFFRENLVIWSQAKVDYVTRSKAAKYRVDHGTVTMGSPVL